MKRELPPARPFGQTSLPTSFLSTSRSKLEIVTKLTKPTISLSDFLDRKIGKAGEKSVQEKQSSFLSAGSAKKKDLGSRNDNVGGDVVLDKAVFRQFNCLGRVSGEDKVGSFQSESTKNDQDSRKRKNPFGAPSVDKRTPNPKYMVVLGDDPKPKPKGLERTPPEKKEEPVYNHYANGSGWWDSDREGIDAEEVGYNEAWEGMGTTTLGGLEWH